MSATGEQRRPARRRTRAVPQLDLGETVHAGRADLRPTRALLRHPSCPRVLDLVRQVRWFFPELDGKEIRVGLTRAAAGFAARNEDWIWINPYRLTRHTIAHELTHLLQNAGHVPQGEKSADLFALARHLSVADDLPCYLITPVSFQRRWRETDPRNAASSDVEANRLGLRRLLHETAVEAVEQRERGRTRYLVGFERDLAARWDESETVNAQTETSEATRQPGLFDAWGFDSVRSVLGKNSPPPAR